MKKDHFPSPSCNWPSLSSQLNRKEFQMKSVNRVVRNIPQHWVGDGFPVRSMLSYSDGNQFDPFLLLDYAGPHTFEPNEASTGEADDSQRGVGEHPHRGFETVTIVYEGEVEHRDSSGSHGTIGPGDVQWMTAASGIVHEEFHSKRFSREGGLFEMVQLWVNLPAKDKSAPPSYQELTAAQFPVATLPSKDGNASPGTVRVIAGDFQGTKGPAKTFTPINVWDLKISADSKLEIEIPTGHNSVIVVQSGDVDLNGSSVQSAEIAVLDRDGSMVALHAKKASRLLVLTGEPIGEPIFGYGPFVMNSRDEIQQAVWDYQQGKMGALSPR